MPAWVRVVLTAIAMATVIAPSAKASAYDDGVRKYQEADYEGAEKLLRRACAEDAANASGHYYLANTLVHLQQHEAAIAEYRAGYVLDGSGSIGGYCSRALKGYGLRLPSAAEAQKLLDTIGGGMPPRQKQKLAAVPTSVAAPEQGRLSRSLTVIRQQLEHEKQKNDSTAEATAADAMTAARNTVKSIQDNAEQQVQRLYAPQRGRPAMSGEEIAVREQQIRSDAKAEEDYVMRQAALKAERYRKLGAMRRSALDQVAENLEAQLSDDGKYSGVKLVPQGTNLYVRSYASTQPVRILPEAHAAVARIYSQVGAGSGNADAAAAADKMPNFSQQERRSVHGKILTKPD